jgi:hypothetical protein
VAGESIASDIIKCRRKRIDLGDYEVDLSPDQRERLRAIFSEGVCDWSKPGVGQRPAAGTWLSFDDDGLTRRYGHHVSPGHGGHDHDDEADD